MTAPFKDEKLDWTSADGKHTGTVTLGNRMRKLQKTVDAEEIELNRQWEEWVESEAELDRLTAEFAAMPTDADHMFSADQREMEEEIKAEIAHVKKLMDEAARSSLNSAKECEKVRLPTILFTLQVTEHTLILPTGLKLKAEKYPGQSNGRLARGILWIVRLLAAMQRISSSEREGHAEALGRDSALERGTGFTCSCRNGPVC